MIFMCVSLFSFSHLANVPSDTCHGQALSVLGSATQGVEAFLPSGGLRDNKEDETRTHITDTHGKGAALGGSPCCESQSADRGKELHGRGHIRTRPLKMSSLGWKTRFQERKYCKQKPGAGKSIQLAIQIHSALSSCRTWWQVLGHLGLVHMPGSLCSSAP